MYAVDTGLLYASTTPRDLGAAAGGVSRAATPGPADPAVPTGAAGVRPMHAAPVPSGRLES